MGPSLPNVLTSLSPDLPVAELKLCRNPNLPNDLLSMEDRQVIRSYKFGLLYAKDGQTTEQDIFRNKLGTLPILPTVISTQFHSLTLSLSLSLSLIHADDTSKAFKEFLNFIGERIELKNWKGYRAGLDVNGNSPPPPPWHFKFWRHLGFHPCSFL